MPHNYSIAVISLRMVFSEAFIIVRYEHYSMCHKECLEKVAGIFFFVQDTFHAQTLDGNLTIFLRDNMDYIGEHVWMGKIFWVGACGTEDPLPTSM